MTTHGLTGTLPSASEGLQTTTTLNNGVSMPWLGLGVWQINSDTETEAAVKAAVGLGYRSIDTATVYGNERGVGRAIRTCGVPREQLFITTKVWNDDIRAGRVEAAFAHSLKLLELDYLDLYLVHWPIAGKIIPTWRAMERLLHTGRVKAIGLSNHLRPHLDELLPAANVVPAINQLELHPYLQSRPLVEYCRQQGIQVEAWSPLMQGGEVLRDPMLTDLAKRHGKTAAQIILRWNLQRGIVTIPKSTKLHRLVENAAVFDFELSTADLSAINTLDRQQRVGPDPLHFNF